MCILSVEDKFWTMGTPVDHQKLLLLNDHLYVNSQGSVIDTRTGPLNITLMDNNAECSTSVLDQAGTDPLSVMINTPGVEIAVIDPGGNTQLIDGEHMEEFVVYTGNQDDSCQTDIAGNQMETTDHQNENQPTSNVIQTIDLPTGLENKEILQIHDENHTGNAMSSVIHSVPKGDEARISMVRNSSNLSGIETKISVSDQDRTIQSETVLPEKLLEVGISKSGIPSFNTAGTSNYTVKFIDKDNKNSGAQDEESVKHDTTIHEEKVGNYDKKSNKYTCTLCWVGFKTINQLLKHRASQHCMKESMADLVATTDKVLLSCRQCARRFKTKASLCAHKRVHKKEAPYKCESCEAQFVFQAGLQKHLPVCGTQEEKKRVKKYKQNILRNSTNTQKYKMSEHKSNFSCNLCSRLFLSQSALTSHKIKIHNKISKPSKQQKYFKGFNVLNVSELSDSERRNLSFEKNEFWNVNYFVNVKEIKEPKNKKSSIDNVNSIKGKLYQCLYCHQCFKEGKAVRKHVIVHKTVCSECGKNTPDVARLRRHRLNAHGSKGDGIFECPNCKKKYGDKAEFLRHMKDHIGPWECERVSCGAQFSERRDLVVHRKGHGNPYPDQGMALFDGTVSEKYLKGLTLQTINDYIEKLDTFTETLVGRVLAVAKCKICREQFTNATITRKHIKMVHLKDGSKEFQCDKCEFSTHFGYHLKKHQKKHDKPFSCHVCVKTYESLAKLNQHLKYHNKDKYQCFYCSKLFVTKKKCIEHISVSHSDEKQDSKADTPRKGTADAMAKERQVNEHTEIAKTELVNNHAGLDTILEKDAKLGTSLVPSDILEGGIVGTDEDIEQMADKVDDSDMLQEGGIIGTGEVMEQTVDKVEDDSLVDDTVADGLMTGTQLAEPQAGLQEYGLEHLVMDDMDLSFNASEANLDEPSKDIQWNKDNSPVKTSPTVKLEVEKFAPVKSDFGCSICGERFQSETEFRSHAVQSYTTLTFCNLCKKDFGSDLELNRHMLSKHSSGMSFTCPKCDTTYSKEASYWQHVKKHTKLFSCYICKDETFTSSQDLRRHMKAHSAERFPCTLCGEICKSSTQLALHKYRVHGVKIRRPKMTKVKRMAPGFDVQDELELEKALNEISSTKEVVKMDTGVAVGNDVTYIDSHGHTVPNPTLNVAEPVPVTPNTKVSLTPQIIEVPNSDVTLEMYADGTIITKDKKGTNFSEINLESLGIDLNTLEGDTNIELLIVQSNGTEVKATIQAKIEKCPPPSKEPVVLNPADLSNEVEMVSLLPNTPKLYKCSKCPRTFKVLETFQNHEEVHTRGATFTCHICQRVFAKKRNLTSHLRLHKTSLGQKSVGSMLKEKKQVWRCLQCDNVFKARQTLRRHVKIVHEGKKEIACPYCQKKFNSERGAHRHIRMHLPPFKCLSCFEEFNTEKLLQEHSKKQHFKSYICPICDIQQDNKKSFSAHVKNSHGKTKEGREIIEKLKVHSCDICEMRFEKSFLLKRHKLTHAENPANEFECSFCEAKFNLKWKLNDHLRCKHREHLHHQCPVCDVEFSTEEDLVIHAKMFHSKDYTCKSCSQTFANFKEYCDHCFTEHQNGYQCKTCSVVFISRRSLYRHTSRFHPVVAGGTCDICGVYFSTKAKLRQHFKNDHAMGPLNTEVNIEVDVDVPDQKAQAKYYHDDNTLPEPSDQALQNICDLCGHMEHDNTVFRRHYLVDHFDGNEDDMLMKYPNFELNSPSKPETKTAKTKKNVKTIGDLIKSDLQKKDDKSKLIAKAKKGIKNKKSNKSVQKEDKVTFLGDHFNLNKASPCSMTSVKSKLYKCNICGERFNRESTLKKHALTHEEDAGIDEEHINLINSMPPLLFKCEECGNMYATKLGLSTHTRMKHPNIIPTSLDESLNTPTKSADKETITDTKVSLESEDKIRKEGQGSSKPTLKARFSNLDSIEKNKQGMFPCTHCQALFKTSLGVLNHIQSLHPIESNPQTTLSPSKVSKSGRVIKKSLKAVDQIQCNVCFKQFAFESSLFRHIVQKHKIEKEPEETYDTYSKESHKSVDQIQCNVCYKQFELESSLLRHIAQKHKKEKEPEETNDTNSKESHKAVDQIQCNVCYKQFELESSLFRHTVQKHKKEKEPEKTNDTDSKESHKAVDQIQCNVCHKEFALESSLFRHIVQKHKKEKEPEETNDTDSKETMCQFCNKAYKNMGSHLYQKHTDVYNDHKNQDGQKSKNLSHNTTKEVAVSHGCESCEEMFPTMQKLSVHFASKHQKQMEKDASDKESHLLLYKCKKCPKSFKTRIALNDHTMKIHHNLNSCKFCGKSFKTRQAVASHETIHMKVLQCGQCSRTFRWAENLEKHRTEVHSDPDLLICGLCNKVFPDRDSMRTHLKQHTSTPNKQEVKPQTVNNITEKKLRSSESDVKMSCNICNKTFSKKSHLLEHMLVHTSMSNEKKQNTPAIKKEPVSNYKNSTVEGHKMQSKTVKAKKNVFEERSKVSFKFGVKKKKLGLMGKKLGIKKEKEVAIKSKTEVKNELTCKLCKKQFDSRHHFQVHAIHVHKKISNAVKERFCSKCNILYKSIKNYQLHHKNVHGKKKLKVKAAVLERSGKKSLKVKTLISQKAGTNLKGEATVEKTFKCDQCNKGLRTLTGLKIHKIHVHGSEREVQDKDTMGSRKECLLCLACQQLYKSELEYKEHLKVFHSVVTDHSVGDELLPKKATVDGMEIKQEKDDGERFGNMIMNVEMVEDRTTLESLEQTHPISTAPQSEALNGINAQDNPSEQSVMSQENMADQSEMNKDNVDGNINSQHFETVSNNVEGNGNGPDMMTFSMEPQCDVFEEKLALDQDLIEKDKTLNTNNKVIEQTTNTDVGDVKSFPAVHPVSCVVVNVDHTLMDCKKLFALPVIRLNKLEMTDDNSDESETDTLSDTPETDGFEEVDAVGEVMGEARQNGDEGRQVYIDRADIASDDGQLAFEVGEGTDHPENNTGIGNGLFDIGPAHTIETDTGMGVTLNESLESADIGEDTRHGVDEMNADVSKLVEKMDHESTSMINEWEDVEQINIHSENISATDAVMTDGLEMDVLGNPDQINTFREEIENDTSAAEGPKEGKNEMKDFVQIDKDTLGNANIDIVNNSSTCIDPERIDGQENPDQASGFREAIGVVEGPEISAEMQHSDNDKVLDLDDNDIVGKKTDTADQITEAPAFVNEENCDKNVDIETDVANVGIVDEIMEKRHVSTFENNDILHIDQYNTEKDIIGVAEEIGERGQENNDIDIYRQSHIDECHTKADISNIGGVADETGESRQGNNFVHSETSHIDEFHTKADTSDMRNVVNEIQEKEQVGNCVNIHKPDIVENNTGANT